MRPLKLTMQAFGSFGRRTVIDFEQVKQNFFPDHGRYGRGEDDDLRRHCFRALRRGQLRP